MSEINDHSPYLVGDESGGMALNPKKPVTVKQLSYIGCTSGVEKYGTTFIGHKFHSGLRSEMILHTRQFKHVFSLHIHFQLNLIKNMEVPHVLKRVSGNSISYILHNYSKCLMCASTA